MTLLDRFRTLSRDKHPDPAIRLAFVDELPLDDRTTIAAIAREDDDPRVRRAAVSKLMAPAALAAIAREDQDEGVRAQAFGMLRDIALEAFEDVGEAESLEAIEAITDPRVLVQIVKSTTRDSVALRALSKIDDGHMLGSVARHANVEAARMHAVQSLRARGDRAELLAVALNSDFKESAVAAMESTTDRDEWDQIIARGKNKSAVKRARALVRDAEEQAAREAAEAAAAATAAMIASTPAILEPEADTASPPHGDLLAAALESDDRRQTNEADRQREEQEQNADRARVQAFAEAEARDTRARGSERRQPRLAELVDEGAAAVADADLASARKRFSLAAREWRDQIAGIDVQPELLARFAELDAQLTGREAAAREADARARREALTRLQQLLTRVEPLATRPDLSLKAADRGLRDIRAALASMPPLPTRQDFDEAMRRLKAAQSALLPKTQELREAEEWKRFANVSVQEQLCAKMEGLRSVEDPEVIARNVRELQQQWRDAADVPRAQADALWRRFKTAHDEVWARCEAYFAAQAVERADNLAKKLALCEKAEALADSTQWIQTAEEIKTLQADWKTIGPVSRGREKAIWDRFRAACDRFFTRRHEDLAQRKVVWAENLATKDVLCGRAEALAESTDWDQAAAEIKKLQAEWRAIGPVKKSKSEAIWQRFRAACDRFFARYASRHDTARAERVAAREAICAELEAFAAAPEPPADLAAGVRALRGRWLQEVSARGVDPDRARALDQRFTAAFHAVIARWPASFAGSDLDPVANRQRMETLVRRMEELASSLAGPVAVDVSISPTNRLAAMLKDALAANTIGGKVDNETRFRAAVEDVRQAQAAWARIGLVSEDVRRQLSDRFQRAVRTITETTQPARTEERGRRPEGQGPRAQSYRSEGTGQRAQGTGQRAEGTAQRADVPRPRS
jgi:uncharacterized protein DUF349